MDRKFEIGAVVFDHWLIQAELEQGQFGNTYLLSHRDTNLNYQSQMKVVSVPRNLQDFIVIQSSPSDSKEYIQSVLNFVLDEVMMLANLAGNPYIMQYLDHQLEPHENGLGCDILIRSEYLPNLLEYTDKHPLSRGDILRMGVEICRALEEAHDSDVIHHDITPEHIYVTASGSFKLGNFSTPCVDGRDLPSILGESEQNYMAPELCKGEHYNQTVDIYALSLVMHQLFNKNRLAFLPDDKFHITEELRTQARELRFGGATLPAPYYGRKGKLGKILARAANLRPELRYPSAQEFRYDLQGLLPRKDDLLSIYPYQSTMYGEGIGKSAGSKLLSGWFV